MVLPPSTPHDAPRPAETAWLDPLKLALGLSRSGLLLLVDHARPALLEELIRGLLPDHPELEVHTEVQRVLNAPHGSTLVLVPRAEDADWLNINRPVFAQRELRVVLFCDTETTIALARQAVDFFDWISHRVECPNRPPRFAVAGLRCALAARAPGIVWMGGDLAATFAVARPRGKLREVSAARPYGELLAELREHRRAWIAFTDVDSQFRLRHVRWALAEAGHRTRAILVEPTISSPGWWPMHALAADPREARTQLEKAGALFPGRLAALNELEPEAITLMCLYLKNGLDSATLEATLLGRASPGLEPKSTWEDLGREMAPLLLRGKAPPPFQRAFTPRDLQRHLRTELTGIQRRLEDNEQVDLEDLASWAAWTTKPVSALASKSPELAAEAWLRNRTPTRIRWDLLTLWAVGLLELDAAESWARRAVSEGHPNAHLMLANVQHAQGHSQEAESLIQEVLRGKAGTSELERVRQTTLPATLASVRLEQGRYQEAEDMLRQALSGFDQDSEGQDLSRGALLNQLARALFAQGKYSEAEALLRQSLSTSRQSQGMDLFYRGGQLNTLARIVSAQGRYDEAEPLLRQSLSVLEQALGAEHPLIGTALYDLATSLRLRGRYAEAEPLFRRALTLQEHNPGASRPTSSALLSGLSSTLRAQGRYEEAEARQRQAVALDERTLGGEHPDHASSLHGLACILLDQGRYAEAEALFRKSLAIRERTQGPSHSELCPTLSNLGVSLAQQGRPGEGEPFLARALELARSTQGPNHPDTAQVLNLLAQIQHVSGNHKARDTAREALEVLTRALGPDHPTTQKVTPVLQAIIAKALGTPGASQP